MGKTKASTTDRRPSKALHKLELQITDEGPLTLRELQKALDSAKEHFSGRDDEVRISIYSWGGGTTLGFCVEEDLG